MNIYIYIYKAYLQGPPFPCKFSPVPATRRHACRYYKGLVIKIVVKNLPQARKQSFGPRPHHSLSVIKTNKKG